MSHSDFTFGAASAPVVTRNKAAAKSSSLPSLPMLFQPSLPINAPPSESFQ
ncbi:hypothetical protein [Geomonas anaerohicana]|uniref:hypothetical protein n=1 Tax=Geomonas anaerohicana TaxID=2798583 RepID=UPI001F41AFAA|nr:hypothetical protein [Geomonas anaerohicana]